MIKILIVTKLKEKNAEFVSGREFSYGETLVVITLYEDCLWSEDVLWLWPKVIEQVQGRKGAYLYPVYIFLIKKHWKFLIHKKFAYGLRLCHTSNFETKFGKFKVIGRKRSEFMQAVYISFRETLQSLTLCKNCLWPNYKAVSFPWLRVSCASLRTL